MDSVLICGANKKERLIKAWELLATHGFIIDAPSPDLLVVQKEGEKKSIGIAQAKEVKKFLQERPFEKKAKAVVIEDAQMLTDDAQGSLLKILEEPPVFALIVLLCDNEGSLLPTVVSRCQKVVLREKPMKDSKSLSTASAVFNLADRSYEELFDLAKEVSQKDKDEVVEFLEGLLKYDIGIALATPSIPPNDLVVKMEKAIKDIKEANVALKFALEYVLLIHKEIASSAKADSVSPNDEY